MTLDDVDLEDGRIGRAYVKAQVAGYEAVYQRWDNEDRVPRSLRILSALVWFDDDGRQWWVHAEQPQDVLERVAGSITVP